MYVREYCSYQGIVAIVIIQQRNIFEWFLDEAKGMCQIYKVKIKLFRAQTVKSGMVNAYL